jgi:hypothetical protein
MLYYMFKSIVHPVQYRTYTKRYGLCLLNVDQLNKYFRYIGFNFQLTSFCYVDKFFYVKSRHTAKIFRIYFRLVV